LSYGRGWSWKVVLLFS